MTSQNRVPFVAAGEVLVDFIALEQARALAETASFGKFFGGAPANVAVNMKRLGVDATIVSKVGFDELGSFLIQYLKDLALDTSYISRDPEYPTSMSIMTRGRTPCEFVAYRQADTRMQRSDIPDELIQGCEVFHTTAHGIARRPTRDAILDAFITAHRMGKITSFDPNYSVTFWPDRMDAMHTLERFIAHATFCKPSMDDAERIFGKMTEAEYLDLFHKIGAEFVILTRGENGALLSNRSGERREYPAIAVADVVDATGAGDAFTAGFFATYLKTGDIDQAMKVGTKTAAFCIRHIGAASPLPPVESFL
ncbi:MAG: carbohydrate kinase [bacterium]